MPEEKQNRKYYLKFWNQQRLWPRWSAYVFYLMIVLQFISFFHSRLSLKSTRITHFDCLVWRNIVAVLKQILFVVFSDIHSRVQNFHSRIFNVTMIRMDTNIRDVITNTLLSKYIGLFLWRYDLITNCEGSLIVVN